MNNRLFRRRHEGILPFAYRGFLEIVFPKMLPWIIALAILAFYVFMAYVELNRGNPN